MYVVVANGVNLFSDDNKRLVERVFRLYQSLYSWATVQMIRKVR